jgi:hypothetical protein
MLKNFLQEARLNEQEAVFSTFCLAIEKELAFLQAELFVAPTEAQFLESIQKRRKACHFSYSEVLQSFSQIALIVAMLQDEVTNEVAKAQKKEELAAINQRILFLLRKAMQEPCYLAFCEEEDFPLTHFLHALVFASYTQPCLLDAFYRIGKPFLEHTEQDHLKAHVKHARHTATKHGLVVEDISLRYIWDNFYVAWGTYLSTTFGRKLVERLGLKKYDPRGDLGNNAGALFEIRERVAVLGRQVLTRVIYTPSPTIGDEPAPELLAFLQALENRHFMTQERLQKDAFPYLTWIYVNLQNLSSEHEGERSYQLMKLNEKYPLSFRAITLAQDSLFYKASLTRQAKNQREEAEKEASCFDEQYKKLMQEELMNPCNWQLSERKHRLDTGYYFADETWKEILPQLVDMAFSLVTTYEMPESFEYSKNVWNWYQKACFRELVHVAIISYHHAQSAYLLAQKVQQDACLVLTCACKESIDRGAKVNATLLWALGKDTHKWHEAVFCALHGRALVTRQRLILHSRVEPFYALLLVAKQSDVQKLITDVQKLVGVEFEGATPLTEKEYFS